MPNKMQKALQKIQKSLSSSNLNYQNVHHHHHSDNVNVKSPRSGGSVRNGGLNGCAFSRSGRLAVAGLRDSDDESDDSAPDDVPEGYLVVYVGEEERRRFVIKAKNLSHPVFKALLNKSAEEYGYEHKGGLEIACGVVFFEHLLYFIETNDPSLSNLEMDELVTEEGALVFSSLITVPGLPENYEPNHSINMENVSSSLILGQVVETAGYGKRQESGVAAFTLKEWIL